MTNYITNSGVQQFSITIASAQTTGTAIINKVGNGAFIIYGGQNPSSTTGNVAYAFLTLTNSTTITATRNTGSSGTTIIVNGCIVDGDQSTLIKSIQYTTININAGASSGNTTVNSVNNSNALVHYLGLSSSDTSAAFASSHLTALTFSGTTLTASRQSAASNSLIIGGEIIEFQGNALNQSVQNISSTTSGSVTSWISTINSVNTNNTLIFYSGTNANATTRADEYKIYASLTNSTTITFNVNTAASIAKTFNCSVVELKSGVLAMNVQRGTTNVSGLTSNTSAITSSVINNSCITWLNNSTNTSINVPSRTEGMVALTNNQNVTVSKSSATSGITGSWEIGTFPPYMNNAIWFGAIA